MADPENPLEEDAIARLKEARQWKSRRLLDFKECYFFTAPSRRRQLSSAMSMATMGSPQDEPELNTDLGFLLVADFVTEVINTYMPEAQMWCERGAGTDVPKELFDQVAEKVKAADKQIFSAIKASNFYAELPKAFNPDLAIAGAGLWIHRKHAHLPIEVLAVPMREIEINLGPNNEIDDRFIVRFVRNSYVRTILGEAIWSKVPDETKKKIENTTKNENNRQTELRWGYWRKWEDIGDEVWQHVVMIADELVHDVEIRGEGCCPFLVMRFNPVVDWPWAIGPMIQGLPTLRAVDDLERSKIEAVERAHNPAIKYPDDSVANVEQGLEPGMGYPVAPGRGEDFGPIYQQPPIDPVIFQLEELEHRLRKLFYVDHPEQTGDTPPTLGQWLDELARMQRRIGMAGYSFWREGPRQIFLRFKYLLEKAGTLAALMVGERTIATLPYNPAQRAAEQQEIATATQAAQIGAQMFPEEWRLVVNGKKTIENFIKKMRVTDLIAMRSEDEIKAALGQLTQLAGVRQRAGGTPAEGAGPPAAA